MHFLGLIALLAGAAATVSAQAQPNVTKADFGQCTPTIDFQMGRAQFNRPAKDGTFYPTDATLIGDSNQIDALAPGIITSFVCNQLVNVCGATKAGVAACKVASADVSKLGTKDQTTADAFNQALGF